MSRGLTVRRAVLVVLTCAITSVECTHSHAPTERASTPISDTAGLAVAVWASDPARASAFLARGVDPDADGDAGHSAIGFAALADDRTMIELLLAHTPHLRDALETRLVLRMAAARDEDWLVDALVTRGIPVDANADERASPLLVAAENGAIAAMRQLLSAGAAPSFVDPEGDTPLAAAVRAGCDPCVELLLAHGADVAHADQVGRSALAWARRTEQPELAARLARAGAPDVPTAPYWSPAPTAAVAIARALPPLQRANASWQADGECTACHQLPMAVRVVEVAARHGFAVDRELARSAVAAIRTDDDKFAEVAKIAFASPDGVLRASMQPAGDLAFGNAWFLAAELDAGLASGPAQQTLATLQARMQQPDGRWRVGPPRGVLESSDLEATALAVQAIIGYGDADARTALPAATRWLARAPRVTVVDHAYALRAAHALGTGIAAASAALRSLQHADGSWSHTPGPGDAYSTGLAAATLIEAGGVAPGDPAIARAAAYLMRTQEADGSWLVPTRAAPLLPYHDRGYPHAKLQFVSFAGTAWATIALVYFASRR